jgi:hypothetical protein
MKMKKNDVLLILSAIAFNCLFFGQPAGINTLLFSGMITALLLIFNREAASQKYWLLYALCASFAGLAVFINANALAVFAWLVSLIILAGHTCSPLNSIMAKGLFAIYSMVRSPFDIASDSWKYFNASGDDRKTHMKKIIVGIPVAALIAIFFLLLYRQANPLFREFTEHLDLTWINVSRILFTLLGLIVVYGLTHGRRISHFADQDVAWLGNEKPPAQLHPTGFDTSTVTGVTLFGLLNLMLLVINCLDVTNIYINGRLPHGITLSDFVHQAVESTIVSIILGVTFIAWLFKGALNFSRSSYWLRIVTYVWIFQSGIVVLNTIVRNYWYVNEYQLTWQRIGVYVFLVLCISGLLYTFIKLRSYKSAWWLVAMNVRTWFLALILSSFINWEQLITGFNISRSGTTHRLDKEYLLELGPGNLPQLVELHNSGRLNPKERLLLYKKLLRAYKNNRFRQWPAFSLEMKRENNALLQIQLAR